MLLTRRTFIPSALASVLAVGCNKSAQGPQKRVIGASLLTFSNPFFKVIGDSLTAEAKKHDFDTIVLSADQDAAKQSNQIRDFITRGVAAIVLSPVDSRTVVPSIREANNAGIPVLTVDIPCREEGVDIVCQIATDNEAGGERAGEAMIEALGDRGGNVAIIHYPEAESCRLRVKGFRNVIDAYNAKPENHGKKITIEAERDGKGSKDDGKVAASSALESVKELRALFCINDPSALGAYTALKNQVDAGEIIIISFDGQPEGRRAVLEGKFYAEPVQFPKRMGVKVVEVIVDHLKGKPVEKEHFFVPTLYRKADAEKDKNIDEWL